MEEEDSRAAIRFVDKHDGFVIVGKNFSFFKRAEDELMIQKLLVMKKRSSSIFKGIQSLSKKENLVEIQFGRIAGIVVSQIFVNNGLRERWPKEDFKILRRIFIRAVDHAILKLPQEARETILGDNRKTYNDILSQPRKFKNHQIFVPMTFIEDFGKELNLKLSAILAEDEALRHIATSYTVLYKFGQNGELESTLEGHMAKFELSAAHEYVIHFRRDFSFDDGVGAFWKRELVCGRMGGISPDEEYFPGLLSQYGNFYFYNENVRGSQPTVALTKFYTSLFSGVHKMRNKHKRPFAIPLVRDYLANKLTHAEITDIEFETLIRFVKDRVNPLPDVVARLELVIANPRPAELTLHDMVEKFRNEMHVKRYNELPKPLQMRDIKQCVDGTILVCANTLQDLLDKKLESTFVAEKADLTLALVCEAILCFSFYGTALYADGAVMYQTKVLDFLDLKKATFKQGNPLRGIAALRNVRVAEGRLQLNVEKIPGAKEPFIGYRLNKEDAIEFERALERVVEAIDCGGFEVAGSPMDCLMKIFMKHFVVTFSLVDANTWNFQDGMKEMLNRLRASVTKRSHHLVMSSTDFLDFIVATEIDPWFILLKIMRVNLGQQHYETFLQNIPVYIDKLLYEERIYLILPGEMDVTCVILPFNTTNEYSLQQLTLAEKEEWRLRFEEISELRPFQVMRSWKIELYVLALTEQINNPNVKISGARLLANVLLDGYSGPRTDVVVLR